MWGSFSVTGFEGKPFSAILAGRSIYATGIL
jgi:hypothetical protein